MERNSNMIAFDMNVLISLKITDCCMPINDEEIYKRNYISKKEKSIYIAASDAYSELNKLIKEISYRLWDTEKAKLLHYIEMLLFSIADREVYEDITKNLKLLIKN